MIDLLWLFNGASPGVNYLGEEGIKSSDDLLGRQISDAVINDSAPAALISWRLLLSGHPFAHALDSCGYIRASIEQLAAAKREVALILPLCMVGVDAIDDGPSSSMLPDIERPPAHPVGLRLNLTIMLRVSTACDYRPVLLDDIDWTATGESDGEFGIVFLCCHCFFLFCRITVRLRAGVNRSRIRNIRSRQNAHGKILGKCNQSGHGTCNGTRHQPALASSARHKRGDRQAS